MPPTLTLERLPIEVFGHIAELLPLDDNLALSCCSRELWRKTTGSRPSLLLSRFKASVEEAFRIPEKEAREEQEEEAREEQEEEAREEQDEVFRKAELIQWRLRAVRWQARRRTSARPVFVEDERLLVVDAPVPNGSLLRIQYDTHTKFCGDILMHKDFGTSFLMFARYEDDRILRRETDSTTSTLVRFLGFEHTTSFVSFLRSTLSSFPEFGPYDLCVCRWRQAGNRCDPPAGVDVAIDYAERARPDLSMVTAFERCLVPVMVKRAVSRTFGHDFEFVRRRLRIVEYSIPARHGAYSPLLPEWWDPRVTWHIRLESAVRTFPSKFETLGLGVRITDAKKNDGQGKIYKYCGSWECVRCKEDSEPFFRSSGRTSIIRRDVLASIAAAYPLEAGDPFYFSTREQFVLHYFGLRFTLFLRVLANQDVKRNDVLIE